jgi:hypothetical protein
MPSLQNGVYFWTFQQRVIYPRGYFKTDPLGVLRAILHNRYAWGGGSHKHYERDKKRVGRGYASAGLQGTVERKIM